MALRKRSAQIATAAALVCAGSQTSIAQPAPAPSVTAVVSVAESNKANAIAFWTALNKEGWEAASCYIGPSFHEHSGSSPSGVAELRKYYNTLKADHPLHYSAVMRAIAEGNLVFLHVRDINAPGDFGKARMVYLRFENGKIAEQWTAKQDVPGIRNFNGMF